MKGRFFVKPPPGAFLTYPGLSGFICFAEGAGNPRELFANALGTRGGSGTAAQWARGEEAGGAAMGFTHSTTSLASNVNFGTLPGWQDLALTGNPGTLIARIYWDGSARCGIAERNDGNTVNAGWEWGITATGALGFAAERATANLTSLSSPLVTSGRWMTVATTWDTSNLAAGILFYFDGRLVATAGVGPTNAAGASGTDASRSLIIGNCSFDSGLSSTVSLKGSFGGSISWVAAFRRTLSATEVQDWS